MKLYFSLSILTIFFVMSLLLPLFSNDKPLVFSMDSNVYWPVLQDMSGYELGLESFFIDYSELKSKMDWSVDPILSWSPETVDLNLSKFPSPPSWDHPMGTDDQGRDILVVLLSGFLEGFQFSVLLWLSRLALALFAGLFMGLLGGKIDILGQRLTEAFECFPSLLVVLTFCTFIQVNLYSLIVIIALFSWTGLAQMIRAETMKLSRLDFVRAAEVLGASKARIVFRHLLPNILYIVIAQAPFTLASGLIALASINFLGIGISTTGPSWGELFLQASQHASYAWWIVIYPSFALFMVLAALIHLGRHMQFRVSHLTL